MQRPYGNTWGNEGQRSRDYAGGGHNSGYDPRSGSSSNCSPPKAEGGSDTAVNVFELLQQALSAVKNPPPATESMKRSASEADSARVLEAKKPRYDPLPVHDYGMNNSTWDCSRCGSTNVEGRNDCVKCSSSRLVPMDDDDDGEFSVMPLQGQSDMTERKMRKLFVHGLLPITTTTDLFKYFSKWGPMDHVYVKTDNNGVSKGYGFVHYLYADNADKCLADAPHFILKKKVQVVFSNSQGYSGDSKIAQDIYKQVNSEVNKMKRKQERAEENSKLQLHISNLAPETTAEQLFCHFVRWGNIASYKKPLYTKNGGRISFVTFANEVDAFRCLGEKHVVDGREVVVEVAHAKDILGDGQGTSKEQSQETDPRIIVETAKRLDISGMTPRITNDQLLCYFSRWGGIEDYEVEKDTTGRKTGNGFVRYGNARNAQAALSAKPHTIDGKMVKVSLYMPKERTDTKMQSQKAVSTPQRRSLSPLISIPGLNLTPKNSEADDDDDDDDDDDPFSQRKYVCKVSGCFFKGIQKQFDRHWFERHEPKVKYLICAFCSMGCVDEDALVEHLDFFHGVEDNREMGKFLMNVETEDRNNTQYIMPGNVTRYSCMEPVDSEQDLSNTTSNMPNQSSDDDALRCNEYGCTFTGPTDEFITHWNKEHLMELIYLRCPMCPKTFQKKASLQFHIEHVHQNKGGDKYEDDDEENDSLEAESDRTDQFRYSVTKPESRISAIMSRAEMEEKQKRSEQSSASKAYGTGTDGLPSKHIPTISGMGARNSKSMKNTLTSSSDKKSKKSSKEYDKPAQAALNPSRMTSAQTQVGVQGAPGYIPSQTVQNTAPPLASQMPVPAYSHSVTPIMPASTMNIPSSQTVPAAYPPPLQSAMASGQRVQSGASVPFPPGSVPQTVPQRLPISQHAGQPNFMLPVQPFPRHVPFAPNPSSGTVSTALPQPSLQVMGQPHVISAPPQLINAQPQVTGSNVISAAPQLTSARPQTMPPSQVAIQQQLVQQQHLPRPQTIPLQCPQQYPNMQHTQSSASSLAPTVSSSTNSNSDLPSAYPGVTGATKTTDLATWYKNVTDSLLSKTIEGKKSKDSSDTVEVKKDSHQKIDASSELIKSLKKDTLIAERPNWPQKLKESSPLPSKKTIREKRKSPKKGQIFKPPSVVIPAFKRSSCDSIKAFLTWNELMIKRLECANLHARKKLKAEMDDTDEDSIEESDEEISSDEEKDENNKSQDKTKEDTENKNDDLLEVMKKKAEAIAETLLKEYKKNTPKVNKPAAAAAVDTVTSKQDTNQKGQKGKKKKVKESVEEKQLFGKLVGRAMGMAKRVAAKSAKGDPAMEARAMSWAKQKLLHLKAHSVEQEYIEQQMDHIKGRNTEDAVVAGTRLQQCSPQEEHVAVYVDQHGKEDEEYTLAYIDEGGVHVMDEGYILGEAGPTKRLSNQNYNSSQELQNNRGRGKGMGQGRGGKNWQNRTGQKFKERQLSTNTSGQRFAESGHVRDEGIGFTEDFEGGVLDQNRKRDDRFEQREDDKFGQRRDGTSWQENKRFRGNRRDINFEHGMQEDELTQRNLDRLTIERNSNFRGNNREVHEIEGGPMEFRQQGRFRNYNRTGQRDRRNFIQEPEEDMQEQMMGGHGRGGFRGGRLNEFSHRMEQNWRVSDEWDREKEGYPDEEDARFSDEEFFEFREEDRMSRGSGRSSKHDFMRNEDLRRQMYDEEERNFGRQHRRPVDRHDRGTSDQRIVQVVHDEAEDFPDEELFLNERIVQLVGDEVISDNMVGNFGRANRSDQNFDRNVRDFRRREKGGNQSNSLRGRGTFEDLGEKERVRPRKMGQSQEKSWSQSIDKMSSKEQEKRKGRSEKSGRNKGDERSSSWSQSIEKRSSREQEKSYGGSQGNGPGMKEADKRSSVWRDTGKNTKQDTNSRGKKWGGGVFGMSGTWNNDRSGSRSEEDEFPEDMSEFVVTDVA